MIYPIVLFGNQILRKEASDIDAGYPNLQELIADMFETMYHARGCGLAAPQIGLPINVFVIDTTEMEEETEGEKPAPVKMAFVNAEIIDRFGENAVFCEGCLSVPGISENVVRKESITIEYDDENFQRQRRNFSGMAARVIQHEYDHIMGKTFIDRISPLKRTLLKGKLNDISRGKMQVKYKTK